MCCVLLFRIYPYNSKNLPFIYKKFLKRNKNIFLKLNSSLWKTGNQQLKKK